MEEYIVPILLQVVLIALNAIFASAEAAFLSINSARIEKIIEEGDKKTRKKAKKLQKLTKDSSRFLSTIQVAITLAGFLGSAFAADTFATPLAEELYKVAWIAQYLAFDVTELICVVLITLLLSFFSIVLGELVPKKIAIKNAEKLSLGLCGFIRFVAAIFAPFVWILTKATNGILRMFGINPNEEEEAATEDEIKIILDTSSEKGEIEEGEKELIQNVFEFNDILVSEVCTHRREVLMLAADSTIEEWMEKLSQSRHSYYPIYGEGVDDIVGVLDVKKFFRTGCTTVEQALEEAMDKAYFVPENTTADVLFAKMKETREYFAIVNDEYGGTTGVITIHDLLELLVGDMDDKDDEIIEEIVCINEEENRWKVLGSASLEKLAAELDISLEAEDCDTFGGYIFGVLGEIPDDGTQLELETDELTIKVESVADHRIEETIVTVKPKPVDEDDDDFDEDEDEDGEKRRKRRNKDKDEENDSETDDNKDSNSAKDEE